MFYGKVLFRVPLPEQIQVRKMHHGLGTSSQLLCPFPSCKPWFYPSTAKPSARRNALQPDSKIAIRKHTPFERLLRIWNLLPNPGLNLSALIHACVEKQNDDPNMIMHIGANDYSRHQQKSSKDTLLFVFLSLIFFDSHLLAV